MSPSAQPEKRTKILNMTEPVLALTCTEVSAKHMESLNGLLNWIGELLVAGRFHLTHTIAAFRSSKPKGKAKARHGRHAPTERSLSSGRTPSPTGTASRS
jgi:hypothetical protein